MDLSLERRKDDWQFTSSVLSSDRCFRSARSSRFLLYLALDKTYPTATPTSTGLIPPTSTKTSTPTATATPSQTRTPTPTSTSLTTGSTFTFPASADAYVNSGSTA